MIDASNDRQRIKTTKKFLNLISSHLSNRKDLRGEEYLCVICTNYAVVKPNVLVFRDAHNRKPCNKIMVENHVLLDHMSDIVQDVEPVGDIVIFKNMSMIRGKYIYRPSLHGKNRRWERAFSRNFSDG